MKSRILYILYIFIWLELASCLLLFVPRLVNLPYCNTDTWWRVDWMRNYMRQAVSSGGLFSSFDVYDPVTGWSLKPNLRDEKVFENKILNSNSKGMRGRKEFSYERNSKARIIVLGDSFTFGDEVSDNETYPYYLQELLGSGVEVINMGIRGYGLDQMLLRLEKEGIKYKPDIVLLGFSAFDMERNMLSFRDYAKPKFILKGNSLVQTIKNIPTVKQTVLSEIFRPHFLELMNYLAYFYKTKNCRFSNSIEEEQRAVTIALLNEIKSVSERSGAAFLLFYLPDRGEITDEAYSANEKFAMVYCARYGVTCFNPKKILYKNLSKIQSFLNGENLSHYDSKANRELAGCIYGFLLRNKLVKTQKT